MATYDQRSFRGRNDDGNETTATWKAAINTNWSQALDTKFRVRFEIQETSGTAGPDPSPLWRLQYRKNGGSWTNVTGTSTNVRSTSSSGGVSDGTRTTNQLANGTGTFRQGEVDASNGRVGGFSGGLYTGNDHSEEEFVITLRSADLSTSDLIELRIAHESGPTAIDSYTAIPRINDSTEEHSGSGTISGGGAWSGTGRKTGQGSGTISGAGSVTGAGGKTEVGSGAITGGGSWSASGHKVGQGAGTISGAGSVVGSGRKTGQGSGTISGAGAIDGTIEKEGLGEGTISGAGSWSGTGGKIRGGAGEITGGGSIDATGQKTGQASGAISGSGATSGSGYKQASGAGTISGGGSWTGVAGEQAEGSGTITGGGGWTATGRAESQFYVDCVQYYLEYDELETEAEKAALQKRFLLSHGAQWKHLRGQPQFNEGERILVGGVYPVRVR